MKVKIDSRHFDADRKLIDMIETKCNKLDQYFDRIVGGNVILKLENHSKVKDKVVEFELSVPGNRLFCKQKENSFEAAFNIAMDTMSRQLKRYKQKNNPYS